MCLFCLFVFLPFFNTLTCLDPVPAFIVVLGIESLTEPIFQFINFHIRPLVPAARICMRLIKFS